jgi:hypothetical protein
MVAPRPFSGGAWLDPPEPPAAALLLSASGDGRYLVDGNGDPFLVRGIAAWNIANENTLAEQITRLETEVANGVNCILIQLVSRYQTNAPNDIDSVAPFSTPNVFSTFNASYFQKARELVQLAATYGIVCWIAPMWYGYDSGQGWYDAMVSNGTTACTTYGAAVAPYFVDLDNVVWIGGGDRAGDAVESYGQAVIDGVRSVDTRHLVTWHWNFDVSDSEPVTPQDIAGCYDWGDLATQVTTEYGENDAPVVVLETRYELNTDFGYTSAGGRADILGTMCRGSKGFFWGHEGTWHCGAADTHLPSQSQGHPYALTSTDRLEFTHCMDIFASRPWHLLAPDQTVLSAGNGRACITPSGDCAIIFSPSGTQTIDRTKMSGSFRAYLVDPTSGVETEVAGGPFPNTSTQAIIPTTVLGNNSRGVTDYVIVLELD